MKETRLHCRTVLTEEMLGSRPNDPEVCARYVASKAPDAKTMAEEVAELGSVEYDERGMTVFARDENGVECLLDFQIKGFFKDACKLLKGADSTLSTGLRAYKKEIDGLLFVQPRHVYMKRPAGKAIGDCQRPLRAQTAQGERNALAHSETVPVGTEIEFDIVLLKESLRPFVCEWLDYGRLHGFGQWRNSGKGTFLYELTEGGELVSTNME